MTILCYSLGAVLLIWSIGSIIRKISSRGKIISVAADNCRDCGKCVKVCRRKVFEMTKTENSKSMTVINLEKCTACGDCVRVCKFKALEIIDKRK